MAFDYGRHFGEIKLNHDLTTLPGERTWRLTPPGRDPEPHRIVLYLGCNVSVFARALGIEFEDKYKKYRLWQDPERVLADTTACQRANNVDAAHARELVEATFGRFGEAPDAGSSAAS
jgi:hypothetical protein